MTTYIYQSLLKGPKTHPSTPKKDLSPHATDIGLRHQSTSNGRLFSFNLRSSQNPHPYSLREKSRPCKMDEPPPPTHSRPAPKHSPPLSPAPPSTTGRQFRVFSDYVFFFTRRRFLKRRFRFASNYMDEVRT